MWGASILPIAALATLQCVNAITLHRRDEPAVLGLPISRHQGPQLQKRASKVASTSLYNEQNMYYMVNITIGTPPQNLSLSLDTGSSDIWVNIPSSSYCSTDDDVCSSTGLFNSKDSSTFKKLDIEMNATYVSGTLAVGPYATDQLVIGGATVKDMEFALAETSANPHGILGISYSSATYAAANLDKEYDGLADALVKSGAIKSAAYSLWLNKLDGTGNLLFGGVNKAHYQGELQTVPIVPEYGQYRSLTIALSDISLTTDAGTKSYTTGLPLAVTLDNGSASIALPQELVEPIYKALGAGFSTEDNAGYIPCDMATSDHNLTFSFSGATVTIPLRELVFENYITPHTPKGDCLFGLGYSEAGVNLMGDPFLRGAYVVYDLANNEISLADAKYDGVDDEILEIGTGSGSVPGATLMPSAVTSATGNGANLATATAVPKGTSGSGSGSGSESGSGVTTEAATAGGASSTSTSKGMAALATGHPAHLLPGLLGAGLLLAL
ncbi:acid protease [Aspergillus uvarum CBS 121591]|uniref:Acid protease n=1 Tax=Aspergillus uvarum CBS 121591 TaxID=1448315 RepID=A0A319C7Q4_9EURO|nr:acid protease [Aspergillus uvarum CBS 121591]PYH81274.1 acid protease [Aspergillus uvarum CBS 121591]